jgi:hypothetical protein
LQNLDNLDPFDQRLPCRMEGRRYGSWRMDDFAGPRGPCPRFYLALGTFTLTENNLAAQGGDWGFHPLPNF